mgnify:CR=1 FL=1
MHHRGAAEFLDPDRGSTDPDPFLENINWIRIDPIQSPKRTQIKDLNHSGNNWIWTQTKYPDFIDCHDQGGGEPDRGVLHRHGHGAREGGPGFSFQVQSFGSGFILDRFANPLKENPVPTYTIY